MIDDRPPLRWGFLGAGFVASRAMAPAVHEANGSVLQAAAARDLHRAEALEPVRTCASYAELINSDDVDAVYISLTNEVHEEWVVAALQAGKHVLCEKPLALSADSVERMASAATSTTLVEALWYRWHPRYARTKALLAEGVIGRPTSIASTFCFSGVPLDNYRLDPRRGGGALLDVGPYAVDAALTAVRAGASNTTSATSDEDGRLLVEVEERSVVHGDPAGTGGVDLTTDARLLVDGVDVAITASIDAPAMQLFEVSGELGDLAWPGDEVFTVWRQPCELTWTTPDGTWAETFDAVDPYRLMVEHSALVMRSEAPPMMPLDDSMLLARALDLITGS